jgi:hypothetical protein
LAFSSAVLGIFLALFSSAALASKISYSKDLPFLAGIAGFADAKPALILLMSSKFMIINQKVLE